MFCICSSLVLAFVPAGNQVSEEAAGELVHPSNAVSRSCLFVIYVHVYSECCGICAKCDIPVAYHYRGCEHYPSKIAYCTIALLTSR